MNDLMVIAVDFDGTLCRDEYPGIGEPNLELIEYIKIQQRYGWRFILWTCRTGADLEAAVQWRYREHRLIFDAINDNIPGLCAIYGGSNPRKVYADIYIDDRSSNEFNLPFRGTEKE